MLWIGSMTFWSLWASGSRINNSRACLPCAAAAVISLFRRQIHIAKRWAMSSVLIFYNRSGQGVVLVLVAVLDTGHRTASWRKGKEQVVRYNVVQDGTMIVAQ